MKISILQAQDIERLPHIQPPTWYDIRPIHQYYKQAPHCMTYKAEEENEMVGVGTVIYHDDVAWLAHILVHENHRRKGIGQTISEYLLQKALDKGIKTIYLIATDMGAPVYSKIGFRVEIEYVVYKDFEWDKSQLISPHIKPYSDTYKEALIEMDKTISKENRIDDLCLYLSTGYVYVNNTDVKGFYLPEFGEGLIVAKDTTSGQALMTKRLMDNSTAVFPQSNTSAIAFMEELDVKLSGTIRRMYYGEPRDVDFSKIYNRIGGNLG